MGEVADSGNVPFEINLSLLISWCSIRSTIPLFYRFLNAANVRLPGFLANFRIRFAKNGTENYAGSLSRKPL
jgi:hypothetical protein